MVVLLTATVSLSVSQTSAWATQSEYHADNVFYVTSTSASDIETIGCNQGTSDLDGNYPYRLSLFDFGAQLSDGSGSTLITAVNVTTAQIKALAEDYAANWYGCTVTDFTTFNTIVVGTNNSRASANTSSDGEAWANMIDSLNTWASNQGYTGQLSFSGGNDMEPSWGGSSSAPDTINWSNSYDTHSAGGLMFDYGSADGCPQSSHDNGNCNNGWDQQNIYNVSYGTPDAVPLPEIYFNGMQQEWQEISWWGVSDHGAYFIEGPMNEHDLDSSSYTHTQAWDNLWNTLNAHDATAQNLVDNVSIDDES